jgi:predicted regulator of Ras-like GTPase activity (Roadblock/LC7/MglB family)
VTTKAILKASIRSACEVRLAALVTEVSGIVAAQLTTADGFEVATHSGRMEPGIASRLAAMGSSLWALSQAVSSSTQIGESRNLIVEGEQGHVVLMAVPETRPALSLLVVTNQSSILGQTLWTARNTALDVSRLVLTG